MNFNVKLVWTVGLLITLTALAIMGLCRFMVWSFYPFNLLDRMVIVASAAFWVMVLTK